MKVLLPFPPHWEPMMPHLALPSLTAYLRSHGVEVIQRDLNAEVFAQVLSRGHLSVILRQLRRERRLVRHKGLRAFLTLTEGLRLASVPYFPSALHLTEYDSAYPPHSSQAILAAVRDRDFNLFRSLFERTVLPQIHHVGGKTSGLKGIHLKPTLLRI